MAAGFPAKQRTELGEMVMNNQPEEKKSYV
jgi:hypothetical protein